MQVIAMEIGFYDGARKRVGAEFDMDLKHMKLDEHGQPMLPNWVLPATDTSRRILAHRLKEAEDKEYRAAMAATAHGAGARRRDRFIDVLSESRGPVTPAPSAEAAANAASGNGASGGASKRKVDELAALVVDAK